MLDYALAIGSFVLLAFTGLVVANLLHDWRLPDSLPRRAAHVLGGAAFLIAVLTLDVWTAVALSGVLALSVLALRLGYRRGLRGLGRSVETRDWAETAYPMAATASLAIGWGLLGDRWLAFAPIAFMAWGDSAAGLVRAAIRSGHAARLSEAGMWRLNMGVLWPSMAMLGVCLAAALVFHPYWIGALGAIVATAAERFRLIAHFLWDDNWVPDDPVIVATSLTVMGVAASY